MPNHDRTLASILRVLGGLDMVALIAVVMPDHWLEIAHAWLGLGQFPQGPVVGYLARSASALYALHGAIVVFISFDVARYERLIRFMAIAAVVHGAVILGIDLSQDLPPLWQYGEGPAFAVTGIIVLLAQRRSASP